MVIDLYKIYKIGRKLEKMGRLVKQKILHPLELKRPNQIKEISQIIDKTLLLKEGTLFLFEYLHSLGRV